jgi:Flp pilus assembly protein TadD
LAAFYHDLHETRLSHRHEIAAERLGPANASLKALQALMAFERKDYKKAEVAAEAALKGNLPPLEQARLHRVLGFSLMEAGRRPEAVAHFDASLGLQPEDSTIHYWRGIIKRALGRADEARQDFQNAVHFAPDDRSRARAQQELDSTR